MVVELEGDATEVARQGAVRVSSCGWASDLV